MNLALTPCPRHPGNRSGQVLRTQGPPSLAEHILLCPQPPWRRVTTPRPSCKYSGTGHWPVIREPRTPHSAGMQGLSGALLGGELGLGDRGSAGPGTGGGRVGAAELGCPRPPAPGCRTSPATPQTCCVPGLGTPATTDALSIHVEWGQPTSGGNVAVSDGPLGRSASPLLGRRPCVCRALGRTGRMRVWPTRWLAAASP